MASVRVRWISMKRLLRVTSESCNCDSKSISRISPTRFKHENCWVIKRTMSTLPHSQETPHSEGLLATNETVDATGPPKQGRSYEDAIKVLNTLQSNLDVIKIISANRTSLQDDSLPGTVKYLARCGITLDDLDSLNTIHISGTKGKGSTCAFLESLLRHAGLKTGFYSSPHLISTRERIRINGKPLSPEKFARYFFEVYDGINSQKENEADMPAYFRFLTCMAFHVFIQEKVDVAVIEVGIGGMYDSTNILRKPVVVGITSLGLDHQGILGDTIEKIALQKAGIMKINVPAITVSNHKPSVREILENYAKVTKCPLYQAPSLEEYTEYCKIELGIPNSEVSRLNASLACQLVNTFLSRKFPEKLFTVNTNGVLGGGNNLEFAKPLPLQSWHFEGLKNCSWPGRFQVINKSESLTFYLDGAHTSESFTTLVKWFSETATTNSTRILVFHLTGARSADMLLTPFVASNIFDRVVFCPIVASTNIKQSADNWSKPESQLDLRERCQSHAQAWRDLQKSLNVSTRTESFICDTIEEVICYTETTAQMNFANTGKTSDVLVTGSLHLVGTFLSFLDPNICDR